MNLPETSRESNYFPFPGARKFKYRQNTVQTLSGYKNIELLGANNFASSYRTAKINLPNTKGSVQIKHNYIRLHFKWETKINGLEYRTSILALNKYKIVTFDTENPQIRSNLRFIYVRTTHVRSFRIIEIKSAPLKNRFAPAKCEHKIG